MRMMLAGCGAASALFIATALAFAFGGCQPKTDAEDDGGAPPTPTDDAGADGTTNADGGGDSDGSTNPDGGGGETRTFPPCPPFEPSNPKHHQYGQESATPIITADETWKTGDVYFIQSIFEIKNCNLTLEPGTQVCLGAGNGSPPTISVFADTGKTAKVISKGTNENPVWFERFNDGERYSGFSFGPGASAEMDYTWFINGGVGGLGVLRFAFDASAVLRNVHLDKFYKVGLNTQNTQGAVFGLSADSSVYFDSQQDTSTDPAITTLIRATKSLTPTSVHISSAIPEGSRAIRFVDHNVIEDLTLLGTLNADYVVTSGDLIVRRSGETAIPVLTLEPGARVRFTDGELAVGNLGSGSEGSIVANGTPTNPVVFTSSAQPAARGQWGGLALYAGGMGPTTALSNVRIENAGGGFGTTNIVHCRNPAVGSLEGALKIRSIVTAPYAGPPLTNIEIVRSGADGVSFTCVPAGCLTTDYTAAIKGSDNAGELLRANNCP